MSVNRDVAAVVMGPREVPGRDKNCLTPIRADFPIVAEGQSINKPPLFDGSNYPYWSTRMSIYIRAIDYEMWDVIIDEPFNPSTLNVVSNEMIHKPSLPKNWKTKVTTIHEAKDLNVITLDEFCGSLLTHELELKEKEEEDKREAKEKKKSIALKENILEEELDSLSCDDDEEMAMVAKRLKKLMSQRNWRLARRGYRREQGSSWKTKNKNESNKKEEFICFECKELGHFRLECPLLKEETPKKNRKLNKVMVAATWLDSDTSSSDDEEEMWKKKLIFV
ncbi:Uncharacterized protein TCM_018121 [Theobroma cacao]|uniref:CCHC-type domain-containing protein n=1 Tax=Theobroma cacao TaxID=3641 RepID=A0A061EFY4_THECC|nr:Uncharacterized protein TCM_018121 [Theobroma cacao]